MFKMKKLILFSVIALAITFTACNNNVKKTSVNPKDSTSVSSDSIASDSIVTDSIN